jgi:hypothetical protein
MSWYNRDFARLKVIILSDSEFSEDDVIEHESKKRVNFIHDLCKTLLMKLNSAIILIGKFQY